MKIFLIGFMGSGKTTSGKRLAVALNYPFFDLDHQITAATGMSIPSYFAVYGEDAFRQLEKETLQAYTYPDHCVISTGGGTPCYFDNMDWMNNNGLTVFIDMPPVALAKRLEQGKHKRPLLKDLDSDQMIEFIREKLEGRLLFYRKAKVIINGLSLSTESLHVAVRNAGVK
jgi:shikimate kinase